MAATEKTLITVKTSIHAPVEKVWNFWTEPQHIMKWNNAGEDWHTPKAENDLRKGGKFLSRMEAKDGSFGFDFEGVYDQVKTLKLIEYTLDDGRKVSISFRNDGDQTIVMENFEAENSNSIELQQTGWQAILDNFKKYVESAEFERLHFEIRIDANVDQVYHIMLDEKYFREWTKEFNKDSHFIGSWEKGSKILFLGSDQSGEKGGMVSRIKENIPSKFVSIEHLGVYQNGKEITSGKEVEGWAGALENYSYEASSGSTVVTVDIDVNQEFKSYFIDTYPKALKKLKVICEG